MHFLAASKRVEKLISFCIIYASIKCAKTVRIAFFNSNMYFFKKKNVLTWPACAAPQGLLFMKEEKNYFR